MPTPVGEPGLLSAGRVRRTDERPLAAVVLVDPIVAFARRRIDRAADDRQVGLFDASEAELLRQAGRCFGGSRQHDHTGRQRVEPANDAYVDIPWLVVFFL